jgi:outer membrane protein OmpA-like peptidoglycan-associated protein
MIWLGLMLATPALAVDAHGFTLGGTSGDPAWFTRLGYPDAGPTWSWNAGVVVDYADDPLAEAFPWGREPLLDALATANVFGALSAAGMHFDVQLPVYLVGVDAQGSFTAPGDVRVGAGLPLLKDGGAWRPAVGVRAALWAPSGAEARFVGSPGPRALAVAQVAKEIGPFGVIASAGAMLSVSEEARNLRAGGGPSLGLGAAWRANDAISAMVEVSGESELGFASLPIEATVSGRARLPSGGWATIGAATGLTGGVGSSRWRAFGGVGYAFDGSGRAPPVLVVAPIVDPQADRDGDGFKDVADACPDQPETVDGFTDDDGCPELDGDADGVAFGKDLCPTEPIRPEQDPRYSDGCPKVAEFAGDRIVITETIFFKEGRAELLPSAERVLGAVRDVMVANPGIPYFLVEGHTNSNGSDAYNLRLSDARAFAVIGWLSAHGVESARLVSKGFGETRPLVADTDPDALAVNRRVEFKVLRVEEIPDDARRIELPPEVRSSSGGN